MEERIAERHEAESFTLAQGLTTKVQHESGRNAKASRRGLAVVTNAGSFALTVDFTGIGEVGFSVRVFNFDAVTDEGLTKPYSVRRLGVGLRQYADGHLIRNDS